MSRHCRKCKSPDPKIGKFWDPVWYRFPSLTLTWSRCYSESHGDLGCVTCHDPHNSAEASTVANEAKCNGCHSSSAKSACPINPTKGCIDCHMPRAWIEATHSFKTDHFIRVRDQAREEPGSSRG